MHEHTCAHVCRHACTYTPMHSSVHENMGTMHTRAHSRVHARHTHWHVLLHTCPRVLLACEAHRHEYACARVCACMHTRVYALKPTSPSASHRPRRRCPSTEGHRHGQLAHRPDRVPGASACHSPGLAPRSHRSAGPTTPGLLGGCECSALFMRWVATERTGLRPC